MDPSGRGPDDLVEPDETLWHDRGAGGGDPVPGFRMRHEEPILHLRIVLSQTTSAGIGMRGYIIAVSLSASMTSVAKTALGEECTIVRTASSARGCSGTVNGTVSFQRLPRARGIQHAGFGLSRQPLRLSIWLQL